MDIAVDHGGPVPESLGSVLACLKNGSVEIVRDPETLLPKRLEFRFQVDCPFALAPEEEADHARHRQTVTPGDPTALPLVE